MTRPLLLGHRGARAFKAIPENTLPSFDRALADGCDGFEFDVRLAADRRAIICHDPVFKDARAKTEKLHIARCASDRLPALPSLEDVLARYPSAFLDIELKVRGTEEVVVTELEKHRPKRFVVSSFLPGVLQTLHSLDSELPLGLICETKTQLARWKKLPVLYVIPHRKIARRDLIQEMHDSNLQVLVWTVNRAQEMERFAAWEVDGVISDDTKLLATTLG